MLILLAARLEEAVSSQQRVERVATACGPGRRELSGRVPAKANRASRRMWRRGVKGVDEVDGELSTAADLAAGQATASGL